MTLDIPVGFAHLSIQHQGAGDPQPWYVTFGIAAATGEHEESTRRALMAYKVFAEAGLGNHVTVTGANVVVGTIAEPIRYFQPVEGVAWIGDRTTASLPQNCALLVDKNTMLGGRKNQGRFFLPGALAEGDVDNVGVISPATVAAWQTRADDFIDYLNDAASGSGATAESPAAMVILHNATDPGDEVPTTVSSLTVQGIISTQRRRLR